MQKKLYDDIFYGALTALLFSAFIYLEYFELRLLIFNTLFALSSIALLLYISKRAVLFAGFSIGILWFYWIGYSFTYTGTAYLTPFVTLGFGFVYTLFFGVLALSSKSYIRALLLFLLSFIEPFDFNWMQIELIFIESYIKIDKLSLALVLLALSLPPSMPSKFRYAPLLLLLFTFRFSYPQADLAPLKIKLFNTEVLQEQKWKAENLDATLTMIFSAIQEAKKEHYELIIFPESVFPMYLNLYPKLLTLLRENSHDISIVAGALLYENNQSFNVTYMFEDGELSIAKKMVLVPFGEYIPLPKFAQDFINETFFNGESDFSTGDQPTDFTISHHKFRNAICYEATCQEIYSGDVKYVIATSNNAWFAPSIEPTLQNLLLRFYARKNNVTIYHVANYKGTAIIR